MVWPLVGVGLALRVEPPGEGLVGVADPGPVFGPLAFVAALRTAVRADKKAFVAATLKLTEAEAKKFWPVYDAYQRDLDMANRRRAVAVEGLIGQDKALSDLYAKNLSNEMIAADEIEIKARRTLHNRLMKPLPGRSIMPAAKGARYLQLESKIRAVQAYDIAATIPLVK